jgi:O-antigen/teichoic acid export membrane protein
MRCRLHLDQQIARQHSGFGFKIALNDLISYLRQQTSNFIVTKMAGATMVGLFNKGDSLAKLPFSTISGPVYQPVFRSMAAAQDNPDKIKYLFFRMVSLLILYTLPFYVGLWWLAKPFMIVVYGEHGHPLQILPLDIGHPENMATNRLKK